VRWCEDDEAFFAKARKGWEAEDLVARNLRFQGVKVEHPPLQLRETFEERHAFVGQKDLVLPFGATISVKQRAFDFTCVADIPQHRLPLFVDTVKKVNLPNPPLVTVCVNKTSTAAVWIPWDTKDEWLRRSGFDRDRQISEFWATAHEWNLRDFWQLVPFLKEGGHA